MLHMKSGFKRQIPVHNYGFRMHKYEVGINKQELWGLKSEIIIQKRDSIIQKSALRIQNSGLWIHEYDPWRQTPDCLNSDCLNYGLIIQSCGFGCPKSEFIIQTQFRIQHSRFRMCCSDLWIQKHDINPHKYDSISLSSHFRIVNS